MALIRLEHTPETIKMNVTLNLILPEPGDIQGVPVKERKILYLLHGLSDDSSAWQRFSLIESYAKSAGLVVIMPSVGRSFYLDQPNGQRYFTYLIEELPNYLRGVFGIEPSREDTAIAGLSMGGYGAFKAAFTHPERYFAACSLSGVLSVDILLALEDPTVMGEFGLLFGDLTKVAGSKHDPLVWVREASSKKIDLPRLFMACGKQDPLYESNRQFHQKCGELGLSVDFNEAQGGHEWYFWDEQIKRLIGILFQP